MGNEEKINCKITMVDQRLSIHQDNHHYSVRYHVQRVMNEETEEEKMTRKSDKGIVGKEMPTSSQRYKTGEGLAFKKNNLSNSKEITNALKEK